MRKIPTLFQRNRSPVNPMTSLVNPECQWVLEGEGVPTAKWDGTACLYLEGRLYKRHTIQAHDPLDPLDYPADWLPAQPMPDPHTLKHPGWMPVTDGPDDKWHRTGLRRAGPMRESQTYELCGPKINGNRHQLDRIMLIEHGVHPIMSNPRTYAEILEWLTQDKLYEGIVWHHPDGRMAKVKKRDFRIPW
jgi:hypothetical protein